jgi:YD repeat-containing protein
MIKINKAIAVYFLMAVLIAVASDAVSIHYEYDSLNRLTKVSYGNGTVIAYTYDAAGNRTQMRIEVFGVLPGDLNGDSVVDLKDAVTALQILTGMLSEGSVNLAADVDGDGKIGMTEAIYAMQKVAGL